MSDNGLYQISENNMTIDINSLSLKYFNKLEPFSERYFDVSFCKRFCRMVERFMDNRADLKLACLVAYLSAKIHSCKYMVITAPVFVPQRGINGGYELIKIDNGVLEMEDDIKQKVRSVLQYDVFKRLSAYIVDESGVVQEIDNVEQDILSC